MRLLLIAVLVPGCLASGPPLDPTGTWVTTPRETARTCETLGTFTASMTTIRHGADGYEIAPVDASVTVTGSIDCDPAECRLNMIASMQPTTDLRHAAVTADMTLDADDTITGTGTFAYEYTSGMACDYTLAFSGVRH